MNNNQDTNIFGSVNNGGQSSPTLNVIPPQPSNDSNQFQNNQISPQNLTPNFPNTNQINNQIPNNNTFINQPNFSNQITSNQPLETPNKPTIEGSNNINQSINPFENNNINNPNQSYVDTLKKEEINIQNNQSRFVNENVFNETSINDLNIQGNYNNTETNNYRNDPQVIANLNNTQKKTITITKELKLVIIIALVLFVFIFIMPYIFDFIQNIKY